MKRRDRWSMYYSCAVSMLLHPGYKDHSFDAVEYAALIADRMLSEYEERFGMFEVEEIAPGST